MQNSFIYQVFLRFHPTFQLLQIRIQAIRSQSFLIGLPTDICLEHLRSIFLQLGFPVDFLRQLHYRLRQTLLLSLLHLPPQTCIGLSVQSKGAQPDHQQKQCTKSLEFLHSYSIVISFCFFMRIRNQTIKIYLYD